jgi:hypothetical protein
VAIEVAIALAESWKPFVKSKLRPKMTTMARMKSFEPLMPRDLTDVFRIVVPKWVKIAEKPKI